MQHLLRSVTVCLSLSFLQRKLTIQNLTEINQQLKAAVKERDEYKEKYQQLSRDLLEIDSGFNNIIEKLIVFGRVWAAVGSSVLDILEYFTHIN